MANLDQLIKAWQAGDALAAEAIYDQCRLSIFHLAYGILGQVADAEEVMQDVLTYALTHIQDYDPNRAKFNTWLHTITISRCRDRQRRKVLPQLSLKTWLDEGKPLVDSTPDFEAQMIRAEMQSEVWEAVHRLKPALREAILLRYWANCTYQEMATILNCPLPTVQSRVRLAYQRLRAILHPIEKSSHSDKEYSL